MKWQNKVTNEEVLPRANMQSMEAMLATTQLRLAGHVSGGLTMPRMLLYEERLKEKGTQGDQNLRYKDITKQHLRPAALSPRPGKQLAVTVQYGVGA